MTNIKVTYKTADDYTASITALRAHLLPLQGGLLDVDLEAYEGADLVTIRLNVKTLYVLGFQNNSEAWYYFKDAAPKPTGGTDLKISGDHGSLGIVHHDAVFRPAARFKITEALAYYSAKPGTGDSVSLALGFVAISVSEAVRFTPIQQNITTLLTHEGSGQPIYKPYADHQRYMSNWEKISKDPNHPDHGDVALPHRG